MGDLGFPGDQSKAAKSLIVPMAGAWHGDLFWEATAG